MYNTKVFFSKLIIEISVKDLSLLKRFYFFYLFQAQEERLREQETEKLERARLEEILNMCAEYERQVQREKQGNKTTHNPAPPPAPPPLSTSPTTAPSIHQNR